MQSEVLLTDTLNTAQRIAALWRLYQLDRPGHTMPPCSEFKSKMTQGNEAASSSPSALHEEVDVSFSKKKISVSAAEAGAQTNICWPFNFSGAN